MTIQDAISVSRFLLETVPNKVIAVGIFGSVERDFQGNDLDVVVFVDSATAEEFKSRFNAEEKQKHPDKKAKETIRRRLTKEVLAIDALSPAGIPESYLDIIVTVFEESVECSAERFMRQMTPSPLMYCGSKDGVSHVKIYDPHTNHFLQYSL